ncbi:MAG: hypothetical protein QF752_05360, partial [Planctomycetota bacterium]|nr:hypothetical protein [Planctomycetota bacterium]
MQVFEKILGVYRQRPRLVKVILLLGILGLCLGSRMAWGRYIPLEKRHFYPKTFSTSLALVDDLGLMSITPSSLELRESNEDVRAVWEFLSLKRWRLSQEEWRRALPVLDMELRPNSLLYSRLFEVHVVAWLWEVFGIDWGVVFLFSYGLSTLACLGIFFIARCVAGSAWAGLFASFLYAFSGTELAHSVWSIRDANPTWFFVY